MEIDSADGTARDPRRDAGGQSNDPRGTEIRGLNHWFQTKERGYLHALADINIDVAPGEFVSLLGPSGCGKTTLLRIIGGLVKPTLGTVTIGSELVTKPPTSMAMVFQHHNLLPWRRARQNIEFVLELRGVPRRDRKQQALAALETVHLERFADAYPHELSGGMKQRVGIARALAVEPPMLLMDEPFGALDAQTRDSMQNELLRIWEADRRSVVFVTHSVEEAVLLSDRVLLMAANPGRIVEDLPIDLERPRSGDFDLTKTSKAANEYRRHLLESLRAVSSS